MTPIDAIVITGLLLAVISCLLMTLGAIALIMRIIDRSSTTTHDLCMTRALQIPLNAPAHGDTALEDEHRRLIAEQK